MQKPYILFAFALAACSPSYDVVIRNGTIYDGKGGPPTTADIAIVADSIVAVGTVSGRGKTEIDAKGFAVAPGFINMLSQSSESLIEDGKSQSEIREGVTLQVMGEGESMGPVNDTLRKVMVSLEGDIKYPVTWTTLAGYLDTLVAHGVSANVASFVGATTVRINVLGWDNRAPHAAELDSMQALVRKAMEDGALGVGSSLLYTPAGFAKTSELVALMKAAQPYGGMYISHVRDEGAHLLQSMDELITIAKESGARAEIYHFKASGQKNWGLMDAAIAKVDSARKAGLEITADMYTYPAGATGLDASMPAWVQEGGYVAWSTRLKDPAVRARVKREMSAPAGWESMYVSAGSPDRILLVQFKADSLKQYTGKTLAEVAKMRGTSPEETAMDLVIKDGTRVGTIYFTQSEDNVRKNVAVPWVSFGSDEASQAPEGVFLKSNPHPRAYGTFARVLGKYVRDEHVLTLQEAIRKLSYLPAINLRIKRRGSLAVGNYADIVIFNPDSIADHATFDKPHQYATGMMHVFVNGVQVLANGEHTGAKPGRVVRGPGWKGH